MSATQVFISYSSADEEFRKDLEQHLSLLKREASIETWTFRSIDAGADWKSEIDARLESAQVVLLLVSANFVASDYCWNIEMRRALQRHREGKARVIPIIIRACDWSSAPFAALQALPPSGKPVTSWRPKDKAWVAVAQGLRKSLAQPLSDGNLESVAALAETAVQRAQRLAAESRARRALDEKWSTQVDSAFRAETEAVFRCLEAQAVEITQTTDIQLEAGRRSDGCVVRLKPLRHNIEPLTLHVNPYYGGVDRDKSRLNVSLLFGVMVLPQDARGRPYKTKEYRKARCVFRLTPDGQWTWYHLSSKEHLASSSLADTIISELLQFYDDLEAGRVKQPALY